MALRLHALRLPRTSGLEQFPMVKFDDLWNHHPNITGDAPLLDENTYPDQCAVEMYAALQGAGVNVTSFHGAMSWQKDKPRYAIRAQELADWLSQPGTIFVQPEKRPGNVAFPKMAGRTGIVFFQHYWGPNRQGNHIDLWNSSYLTNRISIWVRVHLGVVIPGIWSNFQDSNQI